MKMVERKTFSSESDNAQLLKKSRDSENVVVKVAMLDGTTLELGISKKSKGQELLNTVCELANILEKEYFGLIYTKKRSSRNWLDMEEKIERHIKFEPWLIHFEVKFYPPDPSQLQEDITRYQLCLQIRNDILNNKLPCSLVTLALLGSYLVQSELGDFNSETMQDDYLSSFKFGFDQNEELESKIMELHKLHKGETPAQAELNFLENAKKLPMYGIDFHSAKDSDGFEIRIGVHSSGLVIFKNQLRMNKFVWPKIVKISFKEHNFYIKLRIDQFDEFQSTVCFKLESYRDAEKLWKSAVEHHSFFRLMSPRDKEKRILPRLGSKFRYSGRTLYQTRQEKIERPAPKFERSLTCPADCKVKDLS
nr:band 4.1-like protein 3 [Onthophagus taurus]